MSDILIENGTFSYDPAARFQVSFTGATDFIMPFTGTIVVPRRPATNGTDVNVTDLDHIRHLNHHDWLFYSFLYPRAPEAALGEPAKNYVLVFPFLRTLDNQPFGIPAANANDVYGRVLILVDVDYSPLDDFSGSRFLQKGITGLYSSRFKENITISSRPKYLLIHLNEDVHLPETLPPISRDKDIMLRGSANDFVLADLRNALNVFPTLSGTVYAFDLAGQPIDGYASLFALDGNVTINVPGADPHLDSIFVQFVDIHGQPLSRVEMPLLALDFEPILDLSPVTGYEDMHLYSLPTSSFPGDDRTFRAVMPNDYPPGTVDADKYKFRHIYVGYWPGFGFPLKKLEPGEKVSFDLKKDFQGDVSTLPRFLRLCVFHPGEEFQTAEGGEIDEDANFKTNHFKLYSDQNEAVIFNTGDDYFADLEAELTQLGPDETLSALYLTNWKSHAHLFIHGAMAAYGIEQHDTDSDVVTDKLNYITDPTNHIIVPLDKTDDPATQFILLANREAQKQQTPFSLRVELKALTATTPVAITEQTHDGYIKSGSLYFWQLKGDNGVPFTHLVTAAWKNSLGLVPMANGNLTSTTVKDDLPPFPVGLLRLGITNEDPPRATLQRTMAYDDMIDTLWTVNAGGDQLPYDDQGKELQLLFLHLRSGKYEYIDLSLDDMDKPSDDVHLHTFDQLIATDPMTVAIVERQANEADQDFADTLVTCFGQIKYEVNDFQQGTVPLSREEWGGLLRQLIAGGPPKFAVKALYWENIQANLDPGENLDKGLTNSAELTAILNRTVVGKRGYAMRDRATRPLGAFHQKGLVIVKEVSNPYSLSGKQYRVVAYLGGMDMAWGRWDRERHHHLDPDRQSGKGWHDVQMKIVGEGAIDVLRNFKQRWEALYEFEMLGDDDCRPINVVPDMDKPIPVPAPLVTMDESGPILQVTRTWPPASCHVNLPQPKAFVGQDGELGSLRTYIKAIEKARKYVIINDQYLFSTEITLALHNALRSENGPECAIVMLPKNLNEADQVDPLIYKWRKRALYTLYYGAQLEGTPSDNQPHYYTIHGPDSGESVKDKVAILTPINRTGDEIYVHSKQILVDDSFMSLGSANFSFRGTTYEMEINTSTVGNKMYKGGTDFVKEQRIDLCRRMLGLPKAYATLLQDWYATFKFLKALETDSRDDSQPTLNLHPLKPMAKQLDPDFIKRAGPQYAGFDAGVDFVISMDDNSPGFLWIARNVIDIDGRNQDDSILVNGANLTATAFYLGEFPRNPVAAYARVAYDLGPSDTQIHDALNNGDVFLYVSVQLPTANDPDPAPLPVASFQIKADTQTGQLLIQKLTNNEQLIPVATERRTVVLASIGPDEANPISTGTYDFDPSAPGSTIIPGSFTDVTIPMMPIPTFGITSIM